MLKAEPFDRAVRAALAHLHDLPYLQTHPLNGLRGKAQQSSLQAALEGLGRDRTGASLRLCGRSGRSEMPMLRFATDHDSGYR